MTLTEMLGEMLLALIALALIAVILAYKIGVLV